MSVFLLTFSRRNGADPVVERFEDANEAMTLYAERERELRGTDRGVVLLVAEDEATLRRTHGHYFKDIDELLEPLRR